MLAANAVTFEYPSRRGRPASFALKDVSVSVTRGTVTTLLGPNGCGKTTLLRLLAGIERPHTGTVTLDGVPLSAIARRAVARRIAVVPQDTHPAFDYSALEMVLLGRHPHLKALELEGPRDLDIAHEAMRATGTDHLADRIFATLSGGERQRVVIASALAQAPDVLLLDEPTTSLDLGYQLEIAALLSGLNRDHGVTMIVTTHDLNLAAAISQHIVPMRDGQVLDSGPVDQMLTPFMIQRLYGIDVDVSYNERAGHLLVVPLRSSR